MKIFVTDKIFMQRYHNKSQDSVPIRLPKCWYFQPQHDGACTHSTAPALRLCRVELRRLCPGVARRVRGSWGLMRRQQTRSVSTNSPENNYERPTLNSGGARPANPARAAPQILVLGACRGGAFWELLISVPFRFFEKIDAKNIFRIFRKMCFS